MAFEIPRGQQIHCLELDSENNLTGHFLLTDERITSTLYDYKEFFHLKVEKPVFLRTMSNNFISLYYNIDGSTGTSSGPSETAVVYHQEISSSLAVIGPDRWTEADRLKVVTFVLPHADQMFRHNSKLDALSALRGYDSDLAELFSVKVGSTTYRARYLATHSAAMQTKQVWPSLEIEFDDGVSIFEYLSYVTDLVAFVSMAFAYKMNPTDIRIGRFGTAELDTAVEREEVIGYHSAEYIWPKLEPTSWLHGYSAFSAWDDARVAHLKESLAQWVERSSHWRPANNLMMRCLSLQNEMSSARLLAACTWFEEIPTAKPVAALPSGHMNEIIRSAQARAEALGYSDLNDRITGALKRIGSETRRDQFSRIIQRIKLKLGHQIVDDDFIKHLEVAMRFRGAAAHGHVNTEDDEKYRAFAKSAYAMEAFCFLLTVEDLPSIEASLNMLSQNLFLQNYRLSF
jgi:ApeA N-terminal domain 1